MNRPEKSQPHAHREKEGLLEAGTIGSALSAEDVKKDIKRLEQEIDHKLGTYSNFSERIEQWTEEDNGVGFGNDISPSSSLDELELLLEKLGERNKQLNESNTSASIRLHHRSKLDDYVQEFRRLKVNVNQAWERSQLIRGRKHEPAADKSVAMDNLIRERGSIHSSLDVADSFLSQATSTRDKLEDQTKILAGTTGKLRNIGKQFPAIGATINKIRAKKNRNTLILGVVISFCICFLLWWWWTS